MIYEEKTIETIPVGPLGLIPLKSCSELGAKVNDWLLLQDIREIPILSKQVHQDSDPEKEKEPSMLPSAVTICTLWLMSAITA